VLAHGPSAQECDAGPRGGGAKFLIEGGEGQLLAPGKI